MQKGRALQEWRSGWPLIVTGLAGSTCIGAHVYPLGVVMKPLTEAYGWTRAEVSAAATISSITVMVLSTFVGLLLDRYGPRRIALAATPFCAVMMSLVAFTGPQIWTWYAAWMLYALGAIFILPIVWGAAIASAFHLSRGLALAIGLSGSGVAAAVYPPLTLWLLEAFGLRGVFPGLGLFTLLFLGPLVLFAFKPRTAAAEAVIAEAAGGEPAWGLTLGQAMRTTMLWRIVLVLAMAAIASSAINIHIQPLFTDRGLTPGEAAAIAASLGPSVLLGRWLGGYLLDRFHARWITVVFFLLPAVGCLLLVQFDGVYGRGLAAAVMIGISVGVEGDLLPFLLSRYFGLRHFGAIYGLGMAVFGAGYALGPYAAGALFDRAGSYDVFMMAVAVALVVAGLVALSYGRYPDPAPRTEEAPDGAVLNPRPG